MPENFANDYESALFAGISNSDTSLTVDSATGAPAANFRIRVENEFMLVTNVSGTTFTVTRGIEGSTAVSHSAGAVVTHVLTAAGLSTGIADGRPINRYHSEIFEECYWQATTNVWAGGCTQVVSGTSAATQNGSAVTSAGHPGIIILSTGTTTTGRCAIGNNHSYQQWGNGRIRFGAVAQLSVLSDATNTYWVQLGPADSYITASSTHGITFRYSHGNNSGKWEAFAANGGVSTVADTGVTVDTNWHTYEWDLNAAGTSVTFYIDGTSVATINSNIPSGPGAVFLPAAINKTAGTTARQLRLDAYWQYLDFTTPR